MYKTKAKVDTGYITRKDYYKTWSAFSTSFSVRSSRHLAWHIVLPWAGRDKAKQKAVKYSLLPSYDTLGCHKCSSKLKIPLETPRFSPEQLTILRDTRFAVSAPQKCSCGNIQTFTKNDGALRVYTDAAESFSLSSGCFPLSTSTITTDSSVASLLEAPCEGLGTTNGFLFRVRKTYQVNHVNLYGCCPHSLAILFPYSDEEIKIYARVFNIVVILGSTVIFPSGHIFKTKSLYPFDWGAFSDPVLTVARVAERNALIEQLVSTVFFDALERYTNKIKDAWAETLDTPRSTVPNVESLPYRWRLDRDTSSILSKYSEMNILALPLVITRGMRAGSHSQDFWVRERGKEPPKMRGTAGNSEKDFLVKLRDSRKALVDYTIPRLAESPESIKQRAKHLLGITTLPPVVPMAINIAPTGLRHPL